MVQHYLGHESPEMTARYAHIHNETMKAAFADYQERLVDIQGQIKPSDEHFDARWIKKNITTQTLPNGFCSFNFNALSNFTDVTKAWLYKQEDVKILIKKAKSPTNNLLMGDQATLIKAKDREINILTKQNKLLRKQIEELRQQLEVSYAALYQKAHPFFYEYSQCQN